ncbi:ferredoxin-type protein NapF [Pelagimonas phthalicica]|nr:ferredoxin-type protein NapF [Pelagimonas phthalicica]
MQHQPKRRAFLTGRMNRPLPMRPPGAIEEEAFQDTCTKCGDCASACPQEIIRFDGDGLPTVDLSTSPCTFCNICAESCEAGAIDYADGWDWRARVDDSCMSANGIMCRTCEDQCDHQAIRFRLLPGGLSEAQFDSDACTGCGACANACPSGSISFYTPKQQRPNHEGPNQERKTQTC